MNWKALFARFKRNSPLQSPATTRQRTHASWGVYPKNAPGDFYVEEGCCTLCGVPWDVAPDHFAVDDEQCYIKRQPTNGAEVRRMIAAMHVQELGRIRYKGREQEIIDAIRANSDD